MLPPINYPEEMLHFSEAEAFRRYTATNRPAHWMQEGETAIYQTGSSDHWERHTSEWSTLEDDEHPGWQQTTERTHYISTSAPAMDDEQYMYPSREFDPHIAHAEAIAMGMDHRFHVGGHFHPSVHIMSPAGVQTTFVEDTGPVPFYPSSYSEYGYSSNDDEPPLDSPVSSGVYYSSSSEQDDRYGPSYEYEYDDYYTGEEEEEEEYEYREAYIEEIEDEPEEEVVGEYDERPGESARSATKTNLDRKDDHSGNHEEHFCRHLYQVEDRDENET